MNPYSKRALRRHHRNRIKHNRIRKKYWGKEPNEWTPTQLNSCVDTPKVCKCCHCHGVDGDKPIQELKMEEAEKNMIKEAEDPTIFEELIDYIHDIQGLTGYGY